MSEYVIMMRRTPGLSEAARRRRLAEVFDLLFRDTDSEAAGGRRVSEAHFPPAADGAPAQESGTHH